MKVLHLISQRPDSTGSGIYLQAIMHQAGLAGHDNYLVAGVQESAVPVLHTVAENNTRFLLFESAEFPEKIVGMSDIMPYPSRKFRDLSNSELERYLAGFKQKLQEAIEQFKPDLIHSHHLWLVSSLAASANPDLPVITSCHGSELRQFHQCPNLRDFVRTGCRRLEAILALSDAQRDEISRYYNIGKDKIFVTGAGYNDSIFYPAEKNSRGTGFIIIYGGKLSRAKGLVWLIQALINLKHLDFHLHLAGGGSGREYEDCLEACSGLHDKVTLHGAVSQQQLADLMRRSDLFVLPSLHEGLPLVILEALACGCQVLATDLAGAREINKHLTNNRLTLIPTPKVINVDDSELEDPDLFVQELESTLTSIIHQPPQPRTPAPIPDHFTWHQVFKRIEKIYYKTSLPYDND